MSNIKYILMCILAICSFNYSQQSKIRVAIFEDIGAGKKGTNNIQLSLYDSNIYATTVIQASDIRAGVLKNYDVLVQPGGSGSKQSKSLEDSGLDSIRSFVSRGGGYLGICAGAYLSTSFYKWSLGILNAIVIDREHWNRGSGDVVLDMTPTGKEFFGLSSDTVTVQYNQGPLLQNGLSDSVADYTTLARFKTEIAENGAPKGVMIGTDAIAMGDYKLGRVFSISPHFEKRDEQRFFIRKAVLWLARKK